MHVIYVMVMSLYFICTSIINYMSCRFYVMVLSFYFTCTGIINYMSFQAFMSWYCHYISSVPVLLITCHLCHHGIVIIFDLFQYNQLYVKVLSLLYTRFFHGHLIFIFELFLLFADFYFEDLQLSINYIWHLILKKKIHNNVSKSIFWGILCKSPKSWYTYPFMM